jgi:hypothetical protein
VYHSQSCCCSVASEPHNNADSSGEVMSWSNSLACHGLNLEQTLDGKWVVGTNVGREWP